MAWVLVGGAAATTLGGTDAISAENRAVSAPVITVDGAGGALDGEGSAFLSASGTMPVGERYGVQLDGMLGQSGERGQGGVGGHFFWRDPNVGLIGASTMWSRIGGWNLFRHGIEAEAYLGDYTLAPSVGIQRGDANRGTTGYANLELGWYATDQIKLSIGGGGFSQSRSGFVGAEWQPNQDEPFSLFATGGGANEGAGSVLFGVRYVLGAGASSLKQQHRHGDPQNIVSFTNASGGGGSAVAARAQANNAAIPNPAPVVPVCFVAGTPILMADGSIKAIEDVVVGDQLRGANGSINRVEELHPSTLGRQPLYAFDGGTAFVTGGHPFMTPAGWKAINPALAEKSNPGLVVGALTVGEVLVASAGEMRISSIQSHDAPAETALFNFSVSDNRTYFVGNGGTFLLVHNK
ncbi:MAG: hypothetical protein K2X44_12740 [Magnetospirillum sp.]|nr:hypothetical protein [Magnetospirillum sp.]